MNNKIKFINTTQAQKIANRTRGKDSFLVEIDGDKISTFNEYMCYIEKVLNFPWECEGISDRYLDWMRDLLWLPYNEYDFIVYNYESFLKKDSKGKKWFIEDFSEIILPWWEYDVLNHMVGAEVKKMNVYLVV